MTDQEWARAFVGCKIAGTGRRFNETVDVLVKKLAQVREEAARDSRVTAETCEPRRGGLAAKPAKRAQSFSPRRASRGTEGDKQDGEAP
jgi:hypothetical protein